MTDEQGRVCVVTDSTADLPADLARREGVTVVPLLVNFPDGETVRDGELTPARFFERMNQDRALPTTSQPAPGDFAEVYERLLAGCTHVISIHISGRLSGTVEAARHAASAFGDRVRVIDSKNATWGTGFQVLAAARKAAAGHGIADVVRTVESVKERVRLIVGLDGLDNLARGGRIGAVSAFLGGLLDVKVLLTVRPDGTVGPVKRVRGIKAALRETVEYVREQMGDATTAAFCFPHVLSPERAIQLRDTITGMYDATEAFVVEAGVVIATHSGTGWAVAFVPGGL